MGHRYGWIPDLPDQRDHLYQVARPVVLPSSVDQRAGFPGVYDQGDLGSCTAQAIAAVVAFDQRRQKLVEYAPSRLFVYYNERLMEGTVDSDAGAMIRDGIKSLGPTRYGAPHETLWDYVIDKFALKPPIKAYDDGKLHPAVQYQRVTNTSLYAMRHAVAMTGPVVIGISIYESFETVTDGNIPLPKLSEPLLGGHAIVVCGYDDATHRFLFRNSWGTGWGNTGYGTLPYAYVTDGNLADDAWVVQLVQ